MTTKKCWVCKLVSLLAGLGALNWGLVGVFNVNLVGAIFGEMSTAARVVYGLVGLAGVLLLVSLVKCCPCCKEGSSCSTGGAKGPSGVS